MLRIGVTGPISIPPLARHLDFPKGPAQKLPSGLGGTPLNNLIEAMLQKEHRVIVFTLDRSVDREVIYEGDRIKICVGPYRSARRARDFFSAERAYLVHAIERERPALIHAHWTYEFAMAALETTFPVLVTAHDAPLRILRHLPDPYRFMRLCMAWSVTRRTRHLAAVSSYVADHFRRYFRFRHPIHIVPNALPSQCFELGRLRINHPRSGPFTVAAVLTGWQGLKNGPVALQAFGILRKSVPDARLILFGQDYAPGGSAETWARSKSLAESVEFAGPAPNNLILNRLANEADVLLHLSLEESFGMAVAEAMALGLPVVGGKTSGAVPWMLENGAAGELVDVRLPCAAANALARIAVDNNRRDQLSRAAYNSACKRFRSEAVLYQYMALYENIC